VTHRPAQKKGRFLVTVLGRPVSAGIRQKTRCDQVDDPAARISSRFTPFTPTRWRRLRAACERLQRHDHAKTHALAVELLIL
jgi:hypothetical protein